MPARMPHPARDIADYLGTGDLALSKTESLCLVADIGGTNARFGLVSDSRDEPREVRNLRCADYSDLVAAIEDFLGRIPGCPRPEAACVAVAGPVLGDRIRLTNAAWDFSVADSRRRLGLARLEVINDFSALALAVPQLPNEGFVRIGTGIRRYDEPMAVIGPGTGLGVAGLMRSRHGWIPIAGEGGHADLPVRTEHEAEIARLLRADHGAVCAETALSGPGLVRLYRAVCAVDGVAPTYGRPEKICAAAREHRDPLASRTMGVFFGLLGTFAGGVALTFGARGGVLLGGGILPGIADLLAASDFRRRFVESSALPGYLEDVATEIIVAATPALRGAAYRLAQR
ncbi:glucokinase [Nocardia sp. NPDC005746]|uniref:glucokinase n=1 Tax=Nocardia sp. NPDC005746 TaxID=3157062 RepID=UPI0033C479F6